MFYIDQKEKFCRLRQLNDNYCTVTKILNGIFNVYLQVYLMCLGRIHPNPQNL